MISVVVLTKDEERNIGECLKTLRWCDEIVIIDDYSEDKTVEFAQKMGAKVYQHHLNNNFAAQRNFGLEKAKGDWVLFIDADERISSELRSEILGVISAQKSAIAEKCEGFLLRRKDWFGGRWLKHGETANVEFLRLGRKEAGKWRRQVHETWKMEGKVGELKNSLFHYPHQTISEFLKQINFHSTLHAQALQNERIRSSLFRIITNPLGKFIQNYIFRLGFLDGMPGLIIALMMSFHSFLARAKLYIFFHLRDSRSPIPSPRRRVEISTSPSEVFPWLAFLAYLVLFPFGQLARLPLQLIEVNVYLTDIIVGLLLTTWVSWHLSKRKRFKVPPLAKPIFLFLIFAILSLIFNAPLLSGREVVVSGLYLIRWIAYAGLYFVIFDLQKHFDKLKWPNLINYLIVLGVMVAIFGLIQYFLWPNLRALEASEWDPHYYRLVSTFLDPGFTGLILVLTLILIVISFFSTPGESLRNTPGVFLKGLVVYLALALTYSRTSYLAYVIGMGIIAWLKKAPKFFLAILLLGLVTLLILPRPPGEGGRLGRRYSIEARIRNWQQSIIIARDHPILGVGFNAYRYAQRDYGFLEKDKWQVSHAGAGADSSLLFVLATTGIPGLLSYLWIWRRAIERVNRGDKGERSDRIVVFASLAALFVHSLFLNSLFYPWIMAWMWILVAKEYR